MKKTLRIFSCCIYVWFRVTLLNSGLVRCIRLERLLEIWFRERCVFVWRFCAWRFVRKWWRSRDHVHVCSDAYARKNSWRKLVLFPGMEIFILDRMSSIRDNLPALNYYSISDVFAIDFRFPPPSAPVGKRFKVGFPGLVPGMSYSDASGRVPGARVTCGESGSEAATSHVFWKVSRRTVRAASSRRWLP